MNRTLDKLILENQINTAIDFCADFHLSEAEIIQRVCDKYKLDQTTVKEYYDSYMQKHA